MRPRARLLVGAVALGLCLSCQKSGAKGLPTALGRKIAEGPAADLRLTNDGKFAVYLLRGQKPRLEGIPEQMLVGELTTISLAGGTPRRLGSGVTNLPGGYFLTADSRWAVFLTGYNAANQSGDLKIADLREAAKESVSVAGAVTFVVSSADSRYLAFVSGGTLRIGAIENIAEGGSDRGIRALGGEVSSAAFTPDGHSILFKRRVSAGGALMVAPVAGNETPRKLGEQIGDYISSPGSSDVAFTSTSGTGRGTYELRLATLGARPAAGPVAAPIADGIGAVQFSPDGQWLAYKGNLRTTALGIGDLFVLPVGQAVPRKVASAVQSFEFSPDSKAIAYLEAYSDVSKGTLGLASLPDGKPRQIKPHVPNFTWSSTGHFLAFVTRIVQPLPSWDLMLFGMGQDDPAKVGTGVFQGYGFAPKDQRLVFRGNCVPSGKVCDLFSSDPRSPAEPARKIAEGIYSFKHSTDGQKLLLTYSGVDRELYDVALYDFRSGARRTIDRRIYLPALFASDDGSKVVYIVGDPPRAGVYLAEGL